MQILLSGGRVRGLGFVSLLAVGAIAVAVSGVAGRSAASRSKIVVHEQGYSLQNAPAGSAEGRGTFTIDLRGTPFGPGGKAQTYVVPGQLRYVKGQAQLPIQGTDHLTSKNGRIDLELKAIEISINPKITPSGGNVFGHVAEYGTWKVGAATGIYRGWKGGGNFAAVYYGYQHVQPYSVEWDGYVTT